MLLPSKPYVYVDTNCLMDFSEEIFQQYDKIYICGYVLSELDKHKMSSDENKKYKARQAGRNIENNEDKIEYVIDENNFNLPKEFNPNEMDNRIISVYKDLYTNDNSIVCVSNDLLFRQKCKLLGLPCEKFESNKDNLVVSYKGYKEITFTNSDLALFYENKINSFGLLTNEYLLLKNENGEIVDKQRWDGSKFIKVIKDSKKNKLDFTYTEKIKPRNVQQELAFDLFQNKNITCKVIFGKHGSGKDLIMATHALSMVKQGVFDKLIFLKNNYEVKNSKPIGFLPGDQRTKLISCAMPLADHVGGIDGLNKLIDEGVIELQHFGFIRGRDIKRSLIYVTEAENMTKEHIQLLIGRSAEGSAVWLNGDFKQVDDIIFERNNGLKQMINSLKGNELFGCIELNITERSKTAQLADLLD